MASETMTLADAIQVCERIMPTISAYAQDIRAVAAMQTLLAHARTTTAGTGAGGGRMTEAMTDQQIIAGIQAAFSLNVLRACWTNADYLDEFKRAALAASARRA